MFKLDRLTIKGFKKFVSTEIKFNNKVNIIVGENESGKSTILEAIDIIVNQRIRSLDKSLIRELINLENINNFSKNPSYKNLPSIYMELSFLTDSGHKPNMINYFGSNNLNKKQSYGIKFECLFDDSFKDELNEYIIQGNIPYEYYVFKWRTFSDYTPSIYNNKIKTLYIDNASKNSTNSYNYFIKKLLNNKFENDEFLTIKHNFHDYVEDFFDKTQFNLNKDNSIGVNHKKILLENIASIYHGGVSLENKGKGMESLIKTSVALGKDSSSSSIVLIEEPENHLSHTTMFKMIKMINRNKENQQLILTTHSDLVASRLNLKNVIWLRENQSSSKLKDLDVETAKYFQKLDNNNFLKFLLSEKLILVEGPTEYLMIPEFFKKIYGKSLESSGIDIISCGGLSYKRYLNLAKLTDKKIVVITDNDNKANVIEEARNHAISNQKIYTDDNIDNYTWEVSLYYNNEEVIKDIIAVDDVSSYSFNKVDYREKNAPHLGKMLNNKTSSAFALLEEIDKLKIPDYAREAIEWIKS